MTRRERAFHLTVWGTYAIAWGVLAVAPRNRADWALENVLVVLFAGVALALRRKFVVSRRASLLCCAFLSLHAIGSHYTYSEVPYDAWFRTLTGHGLDELLGFRRNQYDRLVHFAAGLLLAGPLRELWAQRYEMGSVASRALPVCFVMSASSLYELIEWGAAILFGGDLGAAFLGAQGDPWDAQKDMALATFGAVLAMGLMGRRSGVYAVRIDGHAPLDKGQSR